jgi:flavin reductase (DIM6/NTAB) family NADH-FMN oxidoreductase RutF/nicotinamidase-related amidase
MDGAVLRQAMRAFATGVTVVLTKTGDQTHGMTANAVCSISLDPPLVMLSLDNRARMNAPLVEGTAFSINVLSARQSAVADHFAGRWAWQDDAGEFDSLAETPILNGSLASLACTVETRIPAGDHTMILGRVVEGRVAEETPVPLIFFDGRWTSFPGPEDIFLLDRRKFREELHRGLAIDPSTTALLAIEMKQGYLELDLEAGALPFPAKSAASVLERSKLVYAAMREQNCQIVHVLLDRTASDIDELIENNPFLRVVDQASSGNIPWRPPFATDREKRPPVASLIATELAPHPGELIIGEKQLASAFSDTLDAALRERGIDTVVLVGVNTSTSILHTAFDCFCRNLKTIVLSDCTLSVYGPDMHELALTVVKYGVGWVATSEEFLASLGSAPAVAGAGHAAAS